MKDRGWSQYPGVPVRRYSRYAGKRRTDRSGCVWTSERPNEKQPLGLSAEKTLCIEVRTTKKKGVGIDSIRSALDRILHPAPDLGAALAGLGISIRFRLLRCRHVHLNWFGSWEFFPRRPRWQFQTQCVLFLHLRLDRCSFSGHHVLFSPSTLQTRLGWELRQVNIISVRQLHRRSIGV
jgi:hypothetical protein